MNSAYGRIMNSSGSNRTLAALLSVVLLAACGTTSKIDKGAIYYEQGLYDLAAEEWRPLANEGQYVAQHNMGGLSRKGLGSTPQSLEDAASWFLKSAEQDYVPAMVSLAEVLIRLRDETSADSWLILAARWGNTDAIEHLSQLGLHVPEPDLYYQQQLEQNLENLRNTGSMMRPPIRQRN